MTKNEEASQKTTSSLLLIARKEFTEQGYFQVSLEKIAELGKVTRGAVYHHFKSKKGLFLAVLDQVQQDIAQRIEQEAIKSNDSWQQLILGCLGFIKGANEVECRRILLVDAPAVVGWDAWRNADREHSMDVLKQHIEHLNEQGCLAEGVDTSLMTFSISGALNELALIYPPEQSTEIDGFLGATVSHLLRGFRK